MAQDGTPVSVLLVDSDDVFARDLMSVLDETSFTVKHVTTAAEAIRAIDDQTEVVLLDYTLSDGTGEVILDAVERRPRRPAVGIISSRACGNLWLDLSPRCQMILPKPVDVRRLPDVVKRLAQSSAVSGTVRSFALRHGLSPREAVMLDMASRGRSDKEILHEAGCARGTVATYWQRIFAKTGERSQRDVMAAMLRHVVVAN